MTSLSRLFNISIVLFAIGATAALATDPLEVFHSKYRSLSSIRMNISASDGMRGTIVARRGGRYRIEVGSRTIVCDGKTVWSADAASRSVVINEYKPYSADVSLEKVFFEVMSVYRSQIVESSARATTVRLTAPQPNAIIANVSSVDVRLDASYLVTSVIITSGRSSVTYNISKFKRNPTTTAASFQFTVPAGWETIDLR